MQEDQLAELCASLKMQIRFWNLHFKARSPVLYLLALFVPAQQFWEGQS